MSKTLDKIADFKKEQLLKLLNQCTEPQQMIFKRMYSHKNLDATLEEVCKNITSDNFDWTIQQCERTIEKFRS